MTTRRPRVLVVDDHPGIVKALSRLLARDHDVVGGLTACDQLLATVASLGPDLVILDLNLADTDGINACRQVTQAFPGMRVIVFTAMDEPDILEHALEAGAAAVVNKLGSNGELLEAVRAVLDARHRGPGMSAMKPAPSFGILVVDDDSRAADMMARSLQRGGYDARAAYSGAAALEMMDGFPPRLMLIDLSMPVMNGEDLAREARRRQPGITLVALSGVRGDARTIEAAGFDYYLRKPVSADVVLDLAAAERIRDHEDTP